MTRIEAMRKRVDAATPGPWEQKSNAVHLGESGWLIAPVVKGIVQSMADAELIAHAPQDLRDLLDLVDLLFQRKRMREDKETPGMAREVNLYAIESNIDAALARLDAEEAR